MHLCPATPGVHTVSHSHMLSPQSKPQSLFPLCCKPPHTCHVLCSSHIQVKQTLCPPHSPHKSLINAQMHTHHITAMHAHTHKPLLLYTHEILYLYLLHTYRTTDNLCIPIAYAFKNIQRIFTIYTHRHKPIPDSSRQTQLHTYDAMSWPCAQCHISATIQTHHPQSPNHSRGIALRSCLIAYLLSTHIPGHTLAHGTCIRIHHSAQTQHPVHPHGDSPALCTDTRHGFFFRLYKGGDTPPSFLSRLTYPYKHTIPPVLSRQTTHLARVTRQAEPCHG